MRSDGLATSVRRTPNLSFTITASPRAIGFPLMSTSSVSPASFWSSITEPGPDLELDARERGAQAVAEAGARRLALAAHARLEAMAERIERRVRQAEPEPRGGLPRDPDRHLEEHD